MKFFIKFEKNGSGGWSYAQREISETVYTAIATASKEKADEMVVNVLGERPHYNKWSLKCE